MVRTRLRAPQDALRGAVENSVEQVRRWVEVLTGLDLDADGTLQALDAETWRERRQALQARGGPRILRDEVSQ